jgi:hypothetical protein
MIRRVHNAILRNAALLVPAAERAEWLAEWRAELCYVDHDATAFCLGSLRDALWLRRNGPSLDRTLSMDSPLRCVLLLAGVPALALLLAIASGSLSLSSRSLAGTEEFALSLFWMYGLSLLFLLTLNPLTLGRYPTNRYAPSCLVRLRRWLFLFVKIGLLVPTIFFATSVLVAIFPPASLTVLLGWTFGFRWALADQKERCPVCLHLLTNPVRIGNPAQMVLGWYGTELICTRGHGFLYVPEMPTSWCSTQLWQYLDPTWGSLLPSHESNGTPTRPLA